VPANIDANPVLAGARPRNRAALEITDYRSAILRVRADIATGNDRRVAPERFAGGT